MAKRHVLRTDPALKQLYCKRCNCILPRDENVDIENLIKMPKLSKKGKKRRSKALGCPFCAYVNHIPEKFWLPDVGINKAAAAADDEEVSTK